MQNTKTIVKRKSERLTPTEKKELVKWVNGYITVSEAAGELGVHPSTLDRIMFKGQGAPETVGAIRDVLKKIAA